VPDAACLPVIGRGTFAAGVHPDDAKGLAADRAIEVVPTPERLVVPLLQHRGAPASACVGAREAVTRGQRIGNPTGFISVPIHAPLAGTTAKECNVTVANGRHVVAIPITVGEGNPAGRELFDDVLGGAWPLDGIADLDPADIVSRVKEAGVLGQGGAAFPTHVKLGGVPGKRADVVLVNGCECEPYLTADYRLMIEAAAAIVAGALIVARAVGAGKVVIATESTKSEAAAALAAASGRRPEVRIAILEAKYPMGGEKQTVRAALGRTVPSGGLPLDVGVVVINVGTAATIARVVQRGRPPSHRVVAVTGRGIVTPGNLLAPIGITHGELIGLCGGLTADATRVISGGPMMGFALGTLDVPVTQATSGITVLTRDEEARSIRTGCIRCGRCADSCPLRLVPQRLALASDHERWDLARRYHIDLCMECGCCAYACPAGIPLVQLIRVGKARIPR
jgi:electron transport complex protein RnfC